MLVVIAFIVACTLSCADAQCTCLNMGYDGVCPYCIIGVDTACYSVYSVETICNTISYGTCISTQTVCAKARCTTCRGFFSKYGGQYVITPCGESSDTVCGDCPSNLCGVGYYRTGCFTCAPCTNAPANSVYSGSDPTVNNACPWQCVAGYVSSGSTCVSCPAGYYRTDSMTACASCPRLGSTFAYTKSCVTGQRYVFSNVDCSFQGCAPCLNQIATYNYYIKDSVTGLTSNVYGNCYTIACCTTCSVGQYPSSDCGSGSTSVTCLACRVLPFDPVNPVYYVNTGCIPGDQDSCPVAPCKTCSVDQFVVGCSNGNAGSCQTCPSKPASSIWYRSTQRVCAWQCFDTLYDAGGGACVPCPTTCSVGYYMPPCVGGVASTCQPCVITSWDQPMSYYVGSGVGADNCDWRCNSGYFRLGSIDTGYCAPCKVSKPCPIGYYAQGDCFNQGFAADTITPPVCAQCVAIAAGVYVGNGTMPNNPRSCSFTCNSGYFANGPSTCSICATTCLDGFKISSQCNRTSNIVCTLCDTSSILSYTARLAGVTVRFTNPYSCSDFFCTGQADVQNGACRLCPLGTGKNNSASSDSCAACDITFYANSVGMGCQPVPDDSMSSPDRTNFVCNAGFSPVINNVAPACAYCNVVGQSQLLQTLWQSNTCTLGGWLCPAGQYKNRTQNPPCSRCDQWPVANGVLAAKRTAELASCNTCLMQSAIDYLEADCPVACNVGFYAVQTAGQRTSCKPCLPLLCASGTVIQLCYAPATVNTCVACSVPLGIGETFTLQNGDSCTRVCVKGRYRSASGVCTLCPVGTYANAVNNAPACAQCAAGLFSSGVGAVECVACGSGTVLATTGGSECSPCLSGSYSITALACQNCSGDNVALSAGMSQCTPCQPSLPRADQNHITCLLPLPPCPPGFYLIAGGCALCLQGSYCAGLSSPPVQCPASSPFSSERSSAAADCRLLYQAAYESPSGCPSNSVLRDGAAQAYLQYVSVLQCASAPGYYITRSSLNSQLTAVNVPCPYDCYCPGYGLYLPTPCPASAPFTNRGAASVASCSADVIAPCRPGYYENRSYDTPPMFAPGKCAICPSGAFCLGDINPPAFCDQAARFWSPLGSTSATQCSYANSLPASACPPNTYGPSGVAITSLLQCRPSSTFYISGLAAKLCPTGYYCPGTMLPIQCPQPACALGFRALSSTCPSPGFATPGTGCQQCGLIADNAIFVTPGTCDICCIRNFYMAYNGLCVSVATWQSAGCLPSQYMPYIGPCATDAGACQTCPTPPPSMAYSALGRTLPYGPESCAYVCDRGFYYVNGQCIGCAAGTFKAAAGNDTACAPCAEGQYATGQATACIDCPLHSVSVNTTCRCIPGTYFYERPGYLECITCPVGYFSSPPEVPDCRFCEAGNVCLSPVQLQEGWPCPAGSFASTPYASCTPCQPGTFSAANNSLSCTFCPPGTYADSARMTSCTQCATGVYQVNIGSTSAADACGV